MNQSPIRFRAMRHEGKDYVAATIRLFFGPSVHDNRALHCGRFLDAGENAEDETVREWLRRELARFVADSIRADEWGEPRPSMAELLAAHEAPEE